MLDMQELVLCIMTFPRPMRSDYKQCWSRSNFIWQEIPDIT